MHTDTRVRAPTLPAGVYVLDPEGPIDPGRAPTATGGALVTTGPAPGLDDRRWDLWLAARDDWLAAKLRKTGSEATVRAYTFAWSDLFERFLPAEYGRAIGPWEVGKAHITAWQRDLEEQVIPDGQRNAGQRLAPTTVNARLAAISSYYSYCNSVFTVVDAHGREVPLAHHNPAHAVQRAQTTPYDKSFALTTDQVRAMLAAINRRCLQGARDYALLLTYLYTGRRSAEIVNLRWADISAERGRPAYKWRGKGGKVRRDELPMPAYQAILDYMHAAGRLDEIQPDDYIWTALSTNAERLPNVADYDPARHITTGMVNKIVRRRARRAGIDPDQVHTHTLRHTAAMLRRDAGDDPLIIQRFLNHSTLAVTQIYLQSREVQRDTSWTKVEAILEGDAP